MMLMAIPFLILCFAIEPGMMTVMIVVPVVLGCLIKGLLALTLPEKKSSDISGHSNSSNSQNDIPKLGPKTVLNTFLFPTGMVKDGRINPDGSGVRGKLHFFEHSVIFENCAEHTPNNLNFGYFFKVQTLKNGLRFWKNQEFLFIFENNQDLELAKSIVEKKL